MTGLTKKEEGFVRDYIETDNATKAALNNYDTDDENTAAVIGHRKLRSVKIQNAIKSIADRIPDELLEKVHLEGLEATDEGFPDYSVRHKYLDSAYKLKGIYAPDKSINVNLEGEITNPKARELAEKYESELKKSL